MCAQFIIKRKAAVLARKLTPFVAKTGHDRSPVFLTEEAAAVWIAPSSLSPDETLKALRAGKPKLSLQTEIDRPLAKGWEKRRS